MGASNTDMFSIHRKQRNSALVPKWLVTFVLGLLVCLSAVPSLHAQTAANFSTIALNGQGRPLGGINVSVCQGISVTSVTVSSTAVTLTLSSSPITAGFKIGGQVQVYAVPAPLNSYDSIIGPNGVVAFSTITALTSNSISYVSSTATGSGATTGFVIQIGSSTTSCLPLSTLYTDQTGTVTAPNPTTSDGLGNVVFWATPSVYQLQYAAAGIVTTVRAAQVPGLCVSGNCISPVVNNVPSADQFPGADPCLQIQNAIAVSPIGGRINANFTAAQEANICNESPFANVVNTQTAGRLFLGAGTIQTNSQWVIPAKWIVEGTGGYGGNNCLDTVATADPTVIMAGPGFITNVTIASISSVSNVVTVTTNGPNGLATGNHVIITGVSNAAYNGGWAVSSVNTAAHSFTYSSASAGTGSSSGGLVNIPLIELGDSAVFSLGAQMRFLVIDHASLSGSIAVDSSSANQESGLSHVKIRNYQNNGIRIVAEGFGFPENFLMEHVSVCPGPFATTGTFGVSITLAPTSLFPPSNLQTSMYDVTVNGDPASPSDYPGVGFALTNIGGGNYHNLSAEEVGTSLTCTSCFGGTFSSVVVGPNMTTGVDIKSSSGFGPVFFNVLNQNTGGAGTTLLDERFSPSVSNPNISIIQYLRPGGAVQYIPGTWSGVGSPITGTSSLTAVCSITIPANYIGPGPAGFKIHWSARHSTGTGSVAYQVEYPSGTSQQGATNAATGDVVGESIVINNAGVANAQTLWNGPMNGNAWVGPSNTGTAAVNQTSSSVWRLTFNAANTEQITPRGCWAEVLY